jgi:hypothetical protein
VLESANAILIGAILLLALSIWLVAGVRDAQTQQTPREYSSPVARGG